MRHQQRLSGKELFPSAALSRREQALRDIKCACLRLAHGGDRADWQLAQRIFRAVPELEAA